MNKSHLISNSPIFGGFYNQWRLVRVWKLEQILGVDWFRGKTVLELGCGYGNVGIYLKSLGADITFVDARQEFLDIVRQKDSSAKTIQVDQDKVWGLGTEFDLVIHWGLSYNLRNWEQDLECTLKHARKLAYETAVNKFGYDLVIPIRNHTYGTQHSGCFNNEGSLPSLSAIEKILPPSVVRYEDKTMNVQGMDYTQLCSDRSMPVISEVRSWNDERVYGGRKFWVG